MLSIIDIPTEQTTAATDFLLFIFSLFLMLFIYFVGWKKDKIKAKIWIALFGFLSIASILGAIAHGFQMAEYTNFILWQPLYLSLGLAITMFVVAVIYDFKKKFILWLMILMILMALIFYLITLLIPGAFIIFIIYEGIAMLFALGLYLYLSIKKLLKGAWFMSVGILITIIAAVVQASERVFIKIIWEFDFNGVFHILQIIGLIFFAIGLYYGFKYNGVINNRSKWEKYPTF